MNTEQCKVWFKLKTCDLMTGMNAGKLKKRLSNGHCVGHRGSVELETKTVLEHIS